jgi:hypothetical protein
MLIINQQIFSFLFGLTADWCFSQASNILNQKSAEKLGVCRPNVWSAKRTITEETGSRLSYQMLLLKHDLLRHDARNWNC